VWQWGGQAHGLDSPPVARYTHVAYNWISFKWDPALAGEMVPTRRRTSVQLSGPRVRTGALRFVRAHVPTAAPRDVF